MKYATEYLRTEHTDRLKQDIYRWTMVDDITDEIFDFLDSVFGPDVSDYEDAYNKGIIYHWDDYYSIDVDKVIEAIHDYIQDFEDCDLNDPYEDYPHKDELEKLIPKLRQYEGYTIYYSFVPDELKQEENKDENNN